MKLITYIVDGQTRLGSLEDTAVTDITARVPGIGNDMKSLIGRWPELRQTISDIRARQDYALGDVKLLAPIPRPGKIWGIGLNYADHIEESGMERPAFPSFFTMAQTTVAGPYDDVQRPIVSDALDYEAELVFIVGKGGRHIPPEVAHEHIFGYCCGNDFSVRDWQLRVDQFSLGKSFDTHAPIGPWIVTSEDFDPADAAIRCFVNDEERQSSNTKHLIFSPSDQLSHLSQAMTMEAGDVIFTGTPAGVGAAAKPPRFLRAGDRIRVEIDGIGHIENTVVNETNNS